MELATNAFKAAIKAGKPQIGIWSSLCSYISAEVLGDTLAKLSDEKVKVRIIHSGVGAINESDVLLATASNAIVIGFNVRPVTPDVARTMNLPAGAGVVIVGTLDPSSDAAGKGLQPGDVILSVNQVTIRSAADMTAQINAARAAGRTQVALLVQRGAGPARFLPVRINAR